MPLGHSYDVSLAGVVDSVLTQDREYVGASSETKPTGLLEGKLSHHIGSQTCQSQMLYYYMQFMYIYQKVLYVSFIK